MSPLTATPKDRRLILAALAEAAERRTDRATSTCDDCSARETRPVIHPDRETGKTDASMGPEIARTDTRGSRSACMRIPDRAITPLPGCSAQALMR